MTNKKEDKLEVMEKCLASLKEYLGKKKVTDWLMYVEYEDGDKVMGGLKLDTDDIEQFLVNMCQCLDATLDSETKKNSKLH